MTSLSPSSCRAHPECPEHLRFILEKVINACPPEWVEAQETGEVEARETGEMFSSIDECQRRLNLYSMSQGFCVVITHSTKSPTISTTFSFIHHGSETRNTRKLPRAVERDKNGEVVGARKRELTVVIQTNCP